MQDQEITAPPIEQQTALQSLKMLADDTRWRLLAELRCGDLHVGELTTRLGLPQNTVSYHLGLLRQAGIVQIHRSDSDARVIYYGLDLAALAHIYQRIGLSLALPGTLSDNNHLVRPIVFLCTKNSARSQIAEGWVRHLSGGRTLVRSAGTQPATLHPLAVEAMREVGVDIGYQQAKGLEALVDLDAGIVVTVCDLAREEYVPIQPGARLLHWSIVDPVEPDGSNTAPLERFRIARDQLRVRVEGLLALPPSYLQPIE